MNPGQRKSSPALPSPAAVIDVGATSIRMAIAQFGEDGGVELLEELKHAVSIGKDTFTTGAIRKQTVEQCVEILKNYSRVLREYCILDQSQLRAVATSAVREAGNRVAFLDRIFIATGIQVDLIDLAEVNRLTYLGIQPFFQADARLTRDYTLIIEIGGGNTECILLKDGKIHSSHAYPFGALRLQQSMERYQTPTKEMRHLIEANIQRTVNNIRHDIPQEGKFRIIALGSDIRFAASRLQTDGQQEKIKRISIHPLASFTKEVLAMSEDAIVKKYHQLTFPEAQTLGLTLLSYTMLARSFRLKSIFVADTTLRDGLLIESMHQELWSEEFREQVIHSASDLGRKFGYDEKHARHVAHLSQLLFRNLQHEHKLEGRYELILYTAALLHEIGYHISNRSHHKHSMYLIRNSELFGLGQQDVLMVALVARYHRRASPKPTHDGYASLSREGRVAVVKLSAILRIADALDGAHAQRIRELKCSTENGVFVLTLPNMEDLSIEQIALQAKGTMFEEVFGMPVTLQQEDPYSYARRHA